MEHAARSVRLYEHDEPRVRLLPLEASFVNSLARETRMRVEGRCCLPCGCVRGWTRTIMQQPDLLKGRCIVLDGPYGQCLKLDEYGALLFFALGNGIFSILPLVKGLTEGRKHCTVKVGRMNLVWETDRYHNKLQQWVQSILDKTQISKGVNKSHSGRKCWN